MWKDKISPFSTTVAQRVVSSCHVQVILSSLCVPVRNVIILSIKRLLWDHDNKLCFFGRVSAQILQKNREYPATNLQYFQLESRVLQLPIAILSNLQFFFVTSILCHKILGNMQKLVAVQTKKSCNAHLFWRNH